MNDRRRLYAVTALMLAGIGAIAFLAQRSKSLVPMAVMVTGDHMRRPIQFPLDWEKVKVLVVLEGSHHGYILPGSYVDLISTTPFENDPRITISRIFMEKVLVVAINLRPDPPEPTIGNPVEITVAIPSVAAEEIRKTLKASPFLGVLLRQCGDNLDSSGVVGPNEEP